LYYAEIIETGKIRDIATGEIWCAWIENGEWVKVKSECDSIYRGSTSINTQGEMCDATHLNLCTTQVDCENVSGYWYDDSCLISEIKH